MLVKKENVAKHKAMNMAPSVLKRMLLGTSGSDVKSSAWLLNLFKVREEATVHELAYRLNDHKGKGTSLFHSWSCEEQDLVQATAKAFGERVALEKFQDTIKTAESSLQPVLKELMQLYGLSRIEADMGWFLSTGIVMLFLHASL